MGYACKLNNSNKSKLIKTSLGSYSSNSTITMSSKGYTAGQYQKWTINNFCYATANGSAYRKIASSATSYAQATYTSPSISYNASNGSLSVVPGYIKVEIDASSIQVTNRITTTVYVIYIK